MKTVVLPSRGEFGLKLCYHVPAVHALEPDVVLCEPGEEALYPSAGQLVFVDPPTDDERRGMHPRQVGNQAEMRKHEAWARSEYPEARIVKTKPGMNRRWFTPEPTVPQMVRHYQDEEFEFDVFLAPRWRRYGAKKNWEHWEALAYVVDRPMFVGGVRETTHPAMVNVAENTGALYVQMAWEYPRVLDATIEGMLLSKVVVATDAGLAHLAMLVGCPLILITHADGLVAPGTVDDPAGRPMEPHYWPVKMHRFEEANHRGVPIMMVKHAWESHEPVLARVLSFLEGGV